MRRITLPTLLVVLATSASVLAAQPGQRGANRDANRDANRGPDRGRAADVRGARNTKSAAALLLRQREQLALTDAQVQQLTALSTAQRAARSGSPGDALRIRADLRDAMAENGDPAAARAALDKISAERNARLVAGLQARKDAMAVLTPEQRSKVAERRVAARRTMQANRAQRVNRRTNARVSDRNGRPAGPPDGPRPRGR